MSRARRWFLLLSVLVLPSVGFAEEDHHLVLCGALEPSAALRGGARELADHLGSGYTASHPSAVVLGVAAADIAASLDSRLHAVEPAYRAFFEAWDAFDQGIRRSPLPRDPALRSVLPGYKRAVGDLRALLGCVPPADERAMIPCSAIPIAHLLAVVGGQVHEYLAERHAETYPDQVAAAAELGSTAKALHEVLHDLEIAVPGTRGAWDTLATALDGSALTDTDEPEDVEVKTRLARVGELVANLEGFVASCHVAAAAEATAHDHR